MKKKVLSLILVLCLSAGPLLAQTNNPITVSLGATVNYYYGPGDRNFGKFENERINWQLNAILGYTIGMSKAGKRTQVAAFGHYGFNNNNTINNFINDQGYTTTATSQSSANNFFQLEGGIIIADLIRVSTGIGQQNFDQQTLLSPAGNKPNAKLLKYNSSTIGLQFNLSNSVQWVINCNFASGKDLDNTVLTPASGLQFRF
jgi:hypothetical protein